jgi:signal transduction histidine kinase
VKISLTSLEQAFYEILRQINSSGGDVERVFELILHRALTFCNANLGILFTYEDGIYRAIAHANITETFRDWLNGRAIRADPDTGLGQIARTHKILHIDDVRGEELYRSGNALRIATADLGGARTFLAIPMLTNDQLVGAFTIYRTEIDPFGVQEIETVQAFADQAAIALNNARLVYQLEKSRAELNTSLQTLKIAQDRLVQTEKLAALGQLTAGVAHEIKNPLNFINNFSALSAELTDELNDLLKPIALDSELRQDLDELTGLLKANLDKVVQHGKRADSIVKNMLLHSREGVGEQRLADINALVEESLNLAYHGARAEKPGFHITLKRDLDPSAGAVQVYPQEITRALLNLITNGFYAVARQRSEGGDGIFEPTLGATTKNLGRTVEIRIRDNGTGIPLEVKAKIFNPFFTTKPAGEGTGLGLSMSHDIIVKQHGGMIHVETEPGVFTEFIITLPRNSAGQSPGGIEHPHPRH